MWCSIKIYLSVGLMVDWHFLYWDIQAAGVLAQIERSNKKKQGIQVEFVLVLKDRWCRNYWQDEFFILIDVLMLVCERFCSGTRKKRKPLRQRWWRHTRKKEIHTTPQQGFGMMELLIQLIPERLLVFASLLPWTVPLKKPSLVYLGCNCKTTLCERKHLQQ